MKFTGDFERFQYFHFKTRFLKKSETFFKKLEPHFLVESTKTGNATIPYKTALSKASVVTPEIARGVQNEPLIKNVVLFLFYIFLN